MSQFGIYTNIYWLLAVHTHSFAFPIDSIPLRDTRVHLYSDLKCIGIFGIFVMLMKGIPSRTTFRSVRSPSLTCLPESHISPKYNALLRGAISRHWVEVSLNQQLILDHNSPRPLPDPDSLTDRCQKRSHSRLTECGRSVKRRRSGREGRVGGG